MPSTPTDDVAEAVISAQQILVKRSATESCKKRYLISDWTEGSKGTSQIHDLYGTVKKKREKVVSKGEFKGEPFIEPNPGTLKNGQLQNDMESTWKAHMHQDADNNDDEGSSFLFWWFLVCIL